MPVFIKDLKNSDEIVAGDETLLRELLHPDKADLRIRYSLAHAVVKPGHTTLPHRLKHAEVYYILEGQGMMQIDGETAPVSRGQAVYIPPLAVQSIRNTEQTDLIFLCIVDPAWRREDEEVLS